MFAKDENLSKLSSIRKLMIKMNDGLKNMNDRLKSLVEEDEAKENRPSTMKFQEISKVYSNFLPFWKNLDQLDDRIVRFGSSNLHQTEFNLNVNWTKKFISTISQVLLYETILRLENMKTTGIEIVTVENINSAVESAPHRLCTGKCRPPLTPEFTLGENIFLLPFRCGFRRGIVKNNQGNQNIVVYVAPCGAVISSKEYLMRYLHETKFPIDIDSFTFSVNVEPRRRFVVDPTKILHRVRDLTDGNEFVPIECVNEIDHRSIAVHKYLTKSVWYNGYQPENVVDDVRSSCRCVGDCSTDKCSCRTKNEFKIGYDKFNRLTATGRSSSVLYECNESCSCQTNSCRNRITQKPRSSLLQVFMTNNKRWGVRSLVDLPKGYFVTVVAGVIITEKMAELYGQTITDQYLFDLPSATETNNEARFSLELSVHANVSKFFNHSCDPNMFVQPIDGHDVDRRLPTLAFFTSKSIGAGDELTFDYNYPVGRIVGRDVKCHCGSSKCCGRLL